MEQIKLHLFNGKIIILLITFKDKKNVKRLFMKKIDILLQYKKKTAANPRHSSIFTI